MRFRVFPPSPCDVGWFEPPAHSSDDEREKSELNPRDIPIKAELQRHALRPDLAHRVPYYDRRTIWLEKCAQRSPVWQACEVLIEAGYLSMGIAGS